MIDNSKDTCYFLSRGKIRKCSALNEPCSDAESMKKCKFYKTDRQFYEERNRAVEINRRKGKCAICKYKPYQCELVIMEEPL